jgi:hypothetical protein
MNDEQKQQGQQQQQIFLQRVNHLLDHIRQWATEAGLDVEPGQVQIREKFTGLYTAPSLTISLTGQALAEVVPVSAFVIVADGLVEVRGGWGSREHIAYLLKEGQSFYPIAHNDWYWVEESSGRKVHRMNKETLLETLSMVSDYDFEPT